MDAQEIVSAYQSLVARAIAVLDKAPYWKHVGYSQHARLEIVDDEATLLWPELEHSYGDSHMSEESASFPARLLTISDAELATWKAAEMVKYEKSQRARQAAAQAEARAEELRTLAKLKAKYGDQ